MTSAGVTLAVLMSLAVAYFLGKWRQEHLYRTAVSRGRNSLLGPVITAPARERLHEDQDCTKALSPEQLDAMSVRHWNRARHTVHPDVRAIRPAIRWADTRATFGKATANDNRRTG